MDELGNLIASILYIFIFIFFEIIKIITYLLTNPYVIIPVFIIAVLSFIFPEGKQDE